jgi:hypothetical protein
VPWDEVLHKWKAGELRSGNKFSGPRVNSQKQAVAIMLSEKRKAQEGKTEYQSSGTQKEHVVKKGTLFGKPVGEVIRHPGALKRAAKRAGRSTHEEAESEKNSSDPHKRKRGQLAETLMGFHHG